MRFLLQKTHVKMSRKSAVVVLVLVSLANEAQIGLDLMEQHNFELSFTIDGATEKAKKFLAQFKKIKRVKYLLLVIKKITKCLCYFLIIES
jgi:hypothetical protein